MGKSITPRKKGRALPSDFAACVAADGFATLAIDTDESWIFDPVTFAPSKSGGADRGYADRIRTNIASRTGIDKAEITVSVKRTGDNVVAVAWRKTPDTDDTDDTANVVADDTDDADTDDADDGDDA